MNDAAMLTPSEAEAVIDERIELFGLGALPRVRVSELADGQWRVQWDRQESVVAPMARAAWHAWLEANVGSMDPGALETAES